MSIKVEIFTVCENASDQNGSLTINRSFDSYAAKEFPVSLPDFYIVARFRLPKNEPFSKCSLVVLDPVGELVVKPAEFAVTGPMTNFIFSNRNIILKKSGVYHLVLLEGKDMIASIPLFVKEVLSRNEIPVTSYN